MNYFLELLDRVTGAEERERKKLEEEALARARVAAQNEEYLRALRPAPLHAELEDAARKR